MIDLLPQLVLGRRVLRPFVVRGAFMQCLELGFECDFLLMIDLGLPAAPLGTDSKVVRSLWVLVDALPLLSRDSGSGQRLLSGSEPHGEQQQTRQTVPHQLQFSKPAVKKA